MKYRYFCSYGTFPNCPTCDALPTFQPELKAFSSVQSYAAYAFENRNEEELGDLYDAKEDKYVAEVVVDYGRHCVTDVYVRCLQCGKTLFKSEDNGHGVKLMIGGSECMTCQWGL